MNCQRARDDFAELLDTRTAPTALLETRAHLANCPDCQREFAALSRTLDALDTLPTNPPSTRMRRQFYAMLEEEKHSAASAIAAARRTGQTDTRTLLWRWMVVPLTGCALLVAGFFAGQRTIVGDSVPRLAAVDSSSSETAAMRQELEELRAQVSKMGTLVGYSLLQQQRPANERFRGVLTSAGIEDPNDLVINELISSLAFDPNPNVRLRALEGLYPHAEQELVRAGVLASLPREQNPLVQVSMIDFLAATRDIEAKPALEKISATEAVDQNVRAAARRALAEL